MPALEPGPTMRPATAPDEPRPSAWGGLTRDARYAGQAQHGDRRRCSPSMVAAPLLFGPYATVILTNALLYTILALGLNIVVGYAGLLDLGYAAFFAVGAYTVGILDDRPSAGISGRPSRSRSSRRCVAGVDHRRPDAPAALGLSRHRHARFRRDRPHHRAQPPDHRRAPAASSASSSPGCSAGTSRRRSTSTTCSWSSRSSASWSRCALANSRLGRAWLYVRHDEDAAEAMGIDRVRVKLAAYVIGAIYGSIGGAFFAVNFTAISPQSFSFQQSTLFLMAVILGGMGKIPGVILGAFIVVLGARTAARPRQLPLSDLRRRAAADHAVPPQRHLAGAAGRR